MSSTLGRSPPRRANRESRNAVLKSYRWYAEPFGETPSIRSRAQVDSPSLRRRARERPRGGTAPRRGTAVRQGRSGSGLSGCGEAAVRARCRALLVKGGHAEGDELIDRLITPEGETVWRSPRTQGRAAARRPFFRARKVSALRSTVASLLSRRRIAPQKITRCHPMNAKAARS